MEIEVCTVGGYNEVGKNMTAIRIDDEVVICDMGIFLPPIIGYEGEDYKHLSTDQMINLGAVANDSVISDWKKNVKAIVLGHCHLDHIAGIPYLAAKYRAPIIGSPFTIEVLKSILREDNISLPNKIKVLNLNSKIKISKNITIELISITHSTPQSSMVAIHTPKGIVLYACDFKFDSTPTMGDKVDFKKLREIGKEGVIALICESLYSMRDMKTPSEKVARELLKEVMLGVDNRGKVVFVTTFASHIARIKSAIEFAKKLNRQPLFLGRSMAKYIKAAENIKLVNFSKEGKISGFRKQSERLLKQVEKEREKYVVICTGSQGEPGSILDKIVRGDLDFKFSEGDIVIFSCKTIPTEINQANRKALEEALKAKKVRIFIEIHVSGHSSREDLRDLIKMVKPKNIIPAHGEASMTSAFAELAEEEGYKTGENVFIMRNGQKIIF